ncbi:hypothetical protein J3E74DRAFT_477300 [Bipolaris maydis]|nr:hypothetical protein J3E74DRAFT_477300 [Bipolaris maydis]
MLLTIIMPEYLLGAALSGYVAARKFKKYTKEPGSKGERWTTTHGYYADMGGLVYTLPETPGNFEPRLVAINSKQLRYLLDKGFLDQEPPMSEDEILDKSKGDAFATISAVVQLLWLVTQLITRKVLKLPSSQLEILALAFAVCTSFTYILNYPKPQNIQVPSHVSNLQRNRTQHRILEHTEPEPEPEPETESESDYSNLEEELEERASQSYFKNALWPWEDKKELEAIIRNDKLNPSSQLKILNEGKSYEWIVDADSIGFITGAVILVYVVARLYLLVAPFRELFYLPPEAFIATWSVSLPYFG